MIYEVRFRPEAEKDVEDAAIWYENQSLGLGKEFLDKVSNTLENLLKQPSMYPIVHRNTRRALIHKFPFGIFYIIEENLIIIIAVMHVSRNPRLWKKRTL
jgi:plasmid stabilization system protein ParE